MTTNLASAHDIVDVQNTNCCIVGGGPAGVVLALFLSPPHSPSSVEISWYQSLH
jgi:hypothetical protein